MHLGRVIGKYRLDRRLGHGAMGDVFLGVHVELGSVVAIKILNAAATAEPNGVARFLNEARAVAAIDHEQIARVIDQDKLPDGTPYIVMEFVEGVTLRELIDERGTLGLRLTVQLMLDILSALTVAHARGIVHRDLKPENIRVTRADRAKILDFGIAKVLHVPTPLTQQGMLVGTPYYMSPEQIGGGAIDGRSDLYAVGVMLFECVTGQRPFEGSTVVALLNRHLNQPPPSPRGLRPELPPALESVILRALEKQPTLRFGSAEEFSGSLRKLFGELPADGPVVKRVREAREVATPSIEAPQAATDDAFGNTAKSPSLQVPQGTTEGAFGNTVKTPLTRRFRMPVPVVPVLLVVALGAGLLLWGVVGVSSGPVPVPVPVAPPLVPLWPAGEERVGVRADEALPNAPPSPQVVAVREVVKGPRPRADRTKAPPSPAPVPVPEPVVTPPPAKGVTLIETASNRTHQPVDFDAHAFDPLGFLPRAQALARARMPDAVLTSFSVAGLFSGDQVDLTLSKQFSADYYFRSPAKSVADPRLRDDDQDIPCLTYVVVSAKTIETFTAESFNGCREKPLPKVKCSLKDAFRQAKADGFVDSGKSMKISWLWDGWFFDFEGPNGSMSVACP